jgi:hypothetical protein
MCPTQDVFLLAEDYAVIGFVGGRVLLRNSQTGCEREASLSVNLQDGMIRVNPSGPRDRSELLATQDLGQRR